MAKITKDMIIKDIIDVDENLVEILTSCGMHCVMCPHSSGESLEEASFVHGLDADAVCAALNEYLAVKEQGQN